MSNYIGHFSKSGNQTHSRYQYIIDQNDLIKAFNDSRNYLNYGLLKESDRQRFLIANSQGLKEQFFKTINEDLTKATESLQNEVATDLASAVLAAVHGTSYKGSRIGDAFSIHLGRAFGRALTKIAHAIWSNEDNNR